MARNTVKDPVCGMDCDISTSDKIEHRGETYYFCNPNCKEMFEKNPEHYVRQAPTSTRRGEMGQGERY